ncbi:MAG: response regulator [Methanoregula sp.]
MAPAIRLLYVDDEPTLLEVGKLFLETGGDCVVDTLESAKEALERLNTKEYDAIISDYQMPDMDGIQFLIEVRTSFGQIPFILFTGRGREEVAIKALNAGADFYLQKGGEPKSQFVELIHKVRQAVRRSNAERALWENEIRYRTLFQNALDIIRILDRDGIITYDSLSSEKILGYPYGSLIGKNAFDYIHPDDLQRVKNDLDEAHRKENDGIPTEFRTKKENGDYLWVESVAVNLLGVEGVDGIVVTTRPISERKRAEEELLRKNTELNASYEQITAVEEKLRSNLDELTREELALRESEEKFRSLVEYALEGIFIVDFQGTILFANNAAIRTFDVEFCAEMIGRNVMEFIAPESREDVMRDFMQVAQGHDAYLAHYYVISAKGKKIYVESIGKIITYEGKNANLISIRDITEQKKAEDALKESEQKHRILLDESSDPIFSFYPDGTYRYVNRAFAEGVGKTVDQIIGKKIWDVFSKDEAEKRFSALRGVFATGNGHEFEVRVPRPDGDRYYITTIVPVKDDTGTVVSAICSSKEITTRRRVEEALWQANKKLNLLSGVTRHDIKNQLFALNGFLESLHKKTLNSGLEEYFTRITKTSERIAAMIEFTREYEKIGVTVPAWHDCHTLVNTATRQAPLGRIMVKNDLPAGTEIFVDPLIAKVFYNLMDNAARYGRKISTIRFTLEEREGDRIIVCEDDGNGIPAEEKERIFERGYGKNTGLGLAISREILDITGITIRETGKPGKGARFEIIVPKDRVRFDRE